jgi:hypothetical protein
LSQGIREGAWPAQRDAVFFDDRGQQDLWGTIIGFLILCNRSFKHENCLPTSCSELRISVALLENIHRCQLTLRENIALALLTLWLLASFGEVENTGTSTRDMEKLPLREQRGVPDPVRAGCWPVHVLRAPGLCYTRVRHEWRAPSGQARAPGPA